MHPCNPSQSKNDHTIASASGPSLASHSSSALAQPISSGTFFPSVAILLQVKLSSMISYIKHIVLYGFKHIVNKILLSPEATPGASASLQTGLSGNDGTPLSLFTRLYSTETVY